MDDIKERRRELEKNLREIFERNDEVRAAMQQRDPGGNWSYEDLGTEGEFDDVLNSIGDLSRRELLQIRNAIQRIDNGTYGNCADCGKRIAPERLEAIPWTDSCYACATRRETS